MASKKITELDLIGTIPANDDLLPITDVSDTTQAASGTTKGVTVAELVGSAVNAKNVFLPQSRIPAMTGSSAALVLRESSGGSGTKVQLFDLAFDAATDEQALFLGQVAQAFTTATLKIMYYMAGANTSKAVRWGARLAAVSDTDTGVTAKEFDTANLANVTVPDAAGTVDVASIDMTDNDDMDIADWFCLDIYRDADDAADDAAGDARFMMAWMEYA